MGSSSWLFGIGVGVGIAATVLGLVAARIALVHLPSDVFVRSPSSRGIIVRAVRMALGATLVTLGLFMLVLPGPGVLALALGLVVLDVPLLRRAAVAALRAPRVKQRIDEVRRHAGKAPFELPSDDGTPV